MMRGTLQPVRPGRVFLALLGGLLLAGPARAQVQNGNLLPAPRLATILPMGARAGAAVEVTFTGTDLESPEALVFSHPGIKATPIIPPPPPPPKVDPKKPAPPLPPPPPITKFAVNVGADVPVGFYDVRFVNKWGVSNPRTFVIGDLKEVLEKEPNNEPDKAQKVELGSTINGNLANPVDVDYYSFAGKKGQRVLLHCRCATIDSRLNPELRLLDADHRQIGYNRPPPGEDGLLDVTLPADGEYTVRLCQFTYTVGNQEFFYRLSISTAPHIDLVYPPLVEPGKDTQVTVYGRNLPGGKLDPAAVLGGKVLEKITVTVSAPKDPQALQRLSYGGFILPASALVDGFEYRLKTEAGTSNPFLMLFAEAPVVLDNEANDTPETAQEITLPCEIAGKIEKLGDRDWYTFTAKKGDVYMIEVQSQRLGAPTDMFFSLRQVLAKGDPQEIGQGDDDAQNLGPVGFYTASRDPAPFRFVVPADGKYQLLIGSRFADAAADLQHVYRVRITPERPDFRLFAMAGDPFRPNGLVVGKGGNESYTVYVWRRDGFKGEIALTVEGLPTGVTCRPQLLAGAMKEAVLVVSAAAGAPLYNGEIKVQGTAVVNGNKVVREARPATVVWAVQPGSGIPTLTRLDKGLVLAVREQPPYVLTASEKATVFHGDKLTIDVKAARLWPDMKQPIQIQPVPPELPPGLNLPATTIAPNATDAKIVMVVPGNVPPGTYNFVLRSFAPVPFNKDPKAKQKPNVNVVQSSTPCAVTILPKQVANLSVDNANPSLKAGAQAVIAVRVARQFDYQGEFKVDLVLPAGMQGLAADPVVIGPGQTEAKLMLRTPANAAPGPRQNLTVRAVATVNGNVPLTHETKINVTVVK
jgi:hypothetical protein